MMPLPSRPSNQKSAVCPWKADPFSGDKGANWPSLVLAPPAMQAIAGHRSIQMRMKGTPGVGPFSIIICTGAVLILGLGFASGQEPTENPAEHQREELGINPYTAPSVAE